MVPATDGPRRIGLALPLVLARGRDRRVCRLGGRRLELARALPRVGLVGLATSALALFWGCLALGRLVSARLGDRFDHARFAATSALVASAALVAAVLVPSLPASIVLFGVVGFAYGPVFPLIMAVAGDRYPTRAAAVSGFLAGIGVIGAIVYPPLMGFLSVGVGLGAAMLGAAALALACGIALWFAGGWRAVAERRGRRHPGRARRVTGSRARDRRLGGHQVDHRRVRGEGAAADGPDWSGSRPSPVPRLRR